MAEGLAGGPKARLLGHTTTALVSARAMGRVRLFCNLGCSFFLLGDGGHYHSFAPPIKTGKLVNVCAFCKGLRTVLQFLNIPHLSSPWKGQMEPPPNSKIRLTNTFKPLLKSSVVTSVQNLQLFFFYVCIF